MECLAIGEPYHVLLWHNPAQVQFDSLIVAGHFVCTKLMAAQGEKGRLYQLY